MSVIVRGMKMPTSCLICFCRSGCPAVKKRIDRMSEHPWYPSNYRHKDCPLGDVPDPHGRLIDADALMGRIEHDTPLSSTFEKVVRRYIENALTIIEAEET